MKTQELSDLIGIIEKHWVLKNLLRKYHENDLIPQNFIKLFQGKIEVNEKEAFLMSFYAENNMKYI